MFAPRPHVVRASLSALALLLASCQGTDAAGTGASLQQEDAGVSFDAGAGTLASPFEIETCAQLQGMERDLDAHYRLVRDLDCSGFDVGDGRGFRPVGTTAKPFTGVFDGGEHTISGLTIHRPRSHRVGLFGHTRDARISHVGLLDVDIRGRDNVGALIGWQRGGVVEEAFVRGGTVEGRQRVGSLIGFQQHAAVRDVYGRTDVDCARAEVSGLGRSPLVRHCGTLVGSAVHAELTHSYAAVPGVSGTGLAGGAGPRDDDASYYDCDLTSGCGAHPEGRDTATMQTEAFYVAAGWDFEAVWGMSGPNTYPCLRWEDGCGGDVCRDDDPSCDGQDDDCDGAVDEDYVPAVTDCGLGACAATGELSCVDGDEVDSCEPLPVLDGDEVCDGVDSDCDGSVDEAAPIESTACGEGVCAAAGELRCEAGAEVDTCEPGDPAGDDSDCDGADSDCDGQVDESFTGAATECGVGACAATGTSSCQDGDEVDSCTPGAPTGVDAECDAIDEDCDGSVDEAYVPTDTACGVGACASTGQTSCDEGAVVDACEPGAPTGADDDCDGVDDDCDGQVDEGFVAQATECGVGVCAATGTTSCVDGAIVDSCTDGAPTGADADCDGLDNDCDGVADEGYVPESTSCGVGVCAATGTTSCVDGTVVDGCESGSPTGADADCDGLDNDCDGVVDDGYVSEATSCGVGVCAAAGATSCVDGAVVDSCAAGAPTGDDADCDGLDNDCDGVVDDGYVSEATSCGVGVCAASGATSCVDGSVVDSCAAGAPTGDDADCDGLDNDCDGVVDDGYVSEATSCGVGVCAASGATSCVDGSVVDSCAAGAPTGDDADCDGLDNDCDGVVDDGYVSETTSCGVGVCVASGATSCVDGSVVDSCAAGAPSGDDADCDGLDNNCDGAVDDGYVSEATSCGVGVCAASGVTSCVDGSVVDSCAAGAPTGDDADCDGLDNDCDGVVDDGYVSEATSCGVGVCAASGATSCVDGSVVDNCAAGAPTGADADCDGLDNDCNGAVDDGYVSEATSCGVGVCAASGVTSCVDGSVVDSCASGSPTGADADCDGLDNDCDGVVDDGYVSEATSCGVGVCAASGATSCVDGSVVDSCAAGAPTGADADCDGLDNDCDGVVDDGYVSEATSCGVGVCAASGATSCVGGSVVDSCVSGAPTGADEDCDGLDDDCDGVADDGYVAPPTACGVGACAAVGALVCTAGSLSDTCMPGAPAVTDETCDGADDDCDGAVDEAFVPFCNGSSVTTCGSGTPIVTECDDLNVCNGAESCASGACVPGVPVDVEDGDPCTADVCDPATGEVTHPVADDLTPCPDEDVCDGEEYCLGGVCVNPLPGTPLPCASVGPTARFTTAPPAFDPTSPLNGGSLHEADGTISFNYAFGAGVIEKRIVNYRGWDYSGGNGFTVRLSGETAQVIDLVAWIRSGNSDHPYEIWGTENEDGSDMQLIASGVTQQTLVGNRYFVMVPVEPTAVRYLRFTSSTGRGARAFQAWTRDRNGGLVTHPGAGASVHSVSIGGVNLADIRGRVWSAFGAGEPQEFIVDLPGDRAMMVDHLLIGEGGGAGVRDFELLVSATGTDEADFESVTTGALGTANFYGWAQFAPRPARYVKLRALTRHTPTRYLYLGHFGVFAADQVPETVRFNDYSTPGEAPIQQWHWDFGDGGTSAERFPEHTFPGPGEYVVRLTTLDAYGQSSTATMRLSVHPTPRPTFTPAETPLPEQLLTRLNGDTQHEIPLIQHEWSSPDGGFDGFIPAPDAAIEPHGIGDVHITQEVRDARLTWGVTESILESANRPPRGDQPYDVVDIPWDVPHRLRPDRQLRRYDRLRVGLGQWRRRVRARMRLGHGVDSEARHPHVCVA